MNIHKNARTTPLSRALLVERVTLHGWAVSEAALAAGVSSRTAHKWLVRFTLEGVEGLQDRRSIAAVRRHALPQPWVELIGALRGYRLTAATIAHGLGLARSTVAAVLDRLGMNRLRWLEPPAPVLRRCRGIWCIWT